MNSNHLNIRFYLNEKTNKVTMEYYDFEEKQWVTHDSTNTLNNLEDCKKEYTRLSNLVYHMLENVF